MKKDYTTLKLLGLYLLILFVLVLLSSCGPQKPEYVDKNGKEYVIMDVCVKSHNETRFGYHYGYNFMSSKYEWHNGTYTETICDSLKYDTIEINKDKKYYANNRERR